MYIRKSKFIILLVALVMLLSSASFAFVVPAPVAGVSTVVGAGSFTDANDNEIVLTAGTYDVLDLSAVTKANIKISTGGSVTIGKLITPQIMTGWKFEGASRMTVVQWDPSGNGVSYDGVAFNHVKFIPPQANNGVLINNINGAGDSIDGMTIGSGGLSFTGCEMTGSVFFEFLGVQGGTISFSGCVFTGKDYYPGLVGFNEFVNVHGTGAGANVSITGGTVTNGQFLMGSKTGGSISGVTFNNGSIRLNGLLSNFSITGNTFTSMQNVLYPYGIGMEQRYGQGSFQTVVTIKDNSFGHGYTNRGTAIAYQTGGAGNAQQILAGSAQNASFNIINNDFCGATEAFKDLWAGGGSYYDCLHFSGNIIPEKAVSNTFYNGVADVTKTYFGHALAPSLSTWTPAYAWSTTTPTVQQETPYAQTYGIGVADTTVKKVPVYEKASTKSRKLTTLTYAESRVTVLGISGSFAEIEVDGIEGFIALSKLSVAFSVPPIYITKAKTNAYSDMGMKKADLETTIPKNEEVSVKYIVKASKACVEYEGQELWVKFSSLKLAS